MYGISDYGSMITDRVRMCAYVQALRQAVKPGCVVLDIGTGTGIFAMLACQFGARRVYAIETNDAIQVARAIALANDYAERIEFIQERSSQVTLPERADVIISDLRGVLPLYQHHIPAIVDARQRLLAAGGILIPQQDTLWAAVAEAPELYSDYTTPWNDNNYDLDMQAALPIVTNTLWQGQVTSEQLLVESQCWATLDYATVESPDLSAEMNWTVAHAGTAHGLSVWFNTTLAGGVCFSNAPDKPKLIYDSAFFPWSKPVTLAVGDTVFAALQANLVDEDYIWRWDTCVLDQGQPEQIKATFKQSTFFGVPLSPTQLHKRAASYVPTLNEDGQIAQFMLTLMDSGTALGDIARRVSERFPTHFATWQDALAPVGKLSKKYSRDMQQTL